ncbi:MAG: AbrB/MazE/SpoVT family DNA-binding domain-containing protein [Patescibacteria group bacterium]|nr:AbrB/MazE/SpoVT family DNA-binding domain-containing protein [Patescibacteria group bacterium]
MLKTVRITSKRQVTIPSKIFKALNLDEGGFLIAEKSHGSIILTPAENLVGRLSGVVKVPEKYKNMSADDIIRESKKEYFNG